MNGSLGAAAGLGVVTGLRSFTGVALVARELADRDEGTWWRTRRASRLERWLSEPAVSRTLQVMAAGEIMADKLPGLPDRVAPGPLAGRMAMGALVGALVAGGDRRVAGALVGGIAAAVGAFTGWWLRREVGRATLLPDPALAVAEDAVAIATARELARQV